MPNDAALLIIDVQLAMFDEKDPVYNAAGLLTTVSSLVSRARAAGLPVVYVQHDGEDDEPFSPGKPGWQIHPAIAPQPGELVIRKRHPDAFQETSLQRELETRGVRRLIVAGIQTDLCVDTTCRRAYSLGFQTTLVRDAHSTWSTDELQAPQIIAHHNQVLGSWFVKAKAAGEIQFAEGGHVFREGV